MIIDDNLLITKNVTRIYMNEWLENSIEILDSVTYKVYQGVGDKDDESNYTKD